jgi:uracil-DNA glycosylase family 4
MAPGEEEDRRGSPLVGPSGRMFHTALHMADYKGPVRKLNLVQCRTVRSGLSKQWVNRDPLKREIEFCRQHFLDEELKAFKARDGKILIMLGGLAYDYITQGTYGSFAEARGHRLSLDRTGSAIAYPTRE